jgi:colanic acid/amylovoran biosynthesis protein
MKYKIKKILIINQPLNNRGDEAAHKALVRSIARFFPYATIKILFYACKQDSVDQFKVDNSMTSYINIPFVKGGWKILFLVKKTKFLFLANITHSTKEILRLYKEADLVLNAPGGICMGGFQNWGHICYLSIAKYLKKTIAYYGRSIGPFPTLTPQNRKFKKISLELLHYFSFLSLRDKKSMDLADSLNIKYEPTVDSAFLETPKVDIPQDVTDLIGSKPYIVFVPNLLIWHFAYKGKVSLEDVLKFYKEILNRILYKYPDYSVLMLPQTFNYGSYEGDDINFFRDLKQYTQCDKLIIIPDIYSSDIQQTIISKADCMIGARYHSVVFAINQAIPFVALSYEYKISGLLETLNRTDSMVDITRAFESAENMQNVLEQFSKVLDTANKDVDAQIRAKEIAKNCFDKFVNFCTKHFSIDVK